MFFIFLLITYVLWALCYIFCCLMKFIALFTYRVSPWWCFVFALMTLCTFYILVYTSACGEATRDELLILIWLSFLLHDYYGGCQYVKGTKLILYSSVLLNLVVNIQISLVCKVQFCILYIFFICSVNVFYSLSVFFVIYSGNHSCQNYFVKCILQCTLGKYDQRRLWKLISIVKSFDLL